MLLVSSAPRRAPRRIAAALAAMTVAALALTGCTGEPRPQASLPAVSDAALAPDVVTQLQAAVQHAIGSSGATGAIVGVWIPWAGSWVTGIGTTGTNGEPVTPEMSFRIGDVTRSMSCDALYSLAADGALGLDDPVSKWVYGVQLGDVTLRQLCDGTSGIADVPARVYDEAMQTPDRVWKPRELASFGLGAPRKTPGQSYLSSSTDYLVLGLALERAAKKSAADVLAQRVFAPLGLTATALPGTTVAAPAPSPALPGLTTPRGAGGAFQCTAPNDVSLFSSSIGYTDSGVTSTIAELGSYVRVLAARSLGRAQPAERWKNPLPAGAGAPSWFTATGGTYLAGSLVGQHGTAPGYATAAYADPGTGMAVAVVLNNSTGGEAVIAPLAWELAAIASKAPAAAGRTAPEFGLPWSAEQFHEQITQNRICAPAG